MSPNDFPLILASLSDRESARFANALSAMEHYEREGVLLQVEHGNLKSTLNRTFGA